MSKNIDVIDMRLMNIFENGSENVKMIFTNSRFMSLSEIVAVFEDFPDGHIILNLAGNFEVNVSAKEAEKFIIRKRQELEDPAYANNGPHQEYCKNLHWLLLKLYGLFPDLNLE